MTDIFRKYIFFVLFLLFSTSCVTRYPEAESRYQSENINFKFKLQGKIIINSKRYLFDSLVHDEILSTFKHNNIAFAESDTDKVFEFNFRSCERLPNFPSSKFNSVNYLVLFGTLGLFPIKSTVKCKVELTVQNFKSDLVEFHSSYVISFEERLQLFILFGMNNSDDIEYTVGVPVKHLIEKYYSKIFKNKDQI